jgi:hypothetical protein
VLDHSSNWIYDPDSLRELVTDLDSADADLLALSDRRLLRAEVADGLRWLLHSRYEHVRQRHYATRARVVLTETESSRSAAHWIIELQLSLLRRIGTEEDSRRLAEAAKSNITYQLTFLHHSDEFEAGANRRGVEMKRSEEAGATVDWEAFQLDCQRRRNLLLEAYRDRRLPRVRDVDALLPYVIALTSGQRSPRSSTPLHAAD